jgi:hypothetical protein
MTLEVTAAHKRCAQVSSTGGERILSRSPMSAAQIREARGIGLGCHAHVHPRVLPQRFLGSAQGSGPTVRDRWT